MFGREKIEYKTVDQVRTMRRAGLVVADALATVRSAVRPGMTTADLDALAAAVIGDAGATPSFLGYHGYPATLCVSVNDEVVHGIPGTRELLPGDVVSVDCGAIVDGWHGDSAFSFVLPEADAADVALVEATERALWAGIAALATGERLGDVGNAVEDSIEASAASDGVPYGIIEEYVGHGIGTSMHQPPDVLNYRTRERGPRLKPGMCLAIEPMVTRGERFTQVLEDDWTVVTDDGARAAHWEHSVAILEDGIWVLTAPDGGAAKLAELGVTVSPLDV
ncbi:type I methionyl aminopeptidase [Oerskovia turbata]|uniref:Methionine aminopeptidase n=1 Tax=Oerskovia turbata TaxID=1713 RepID=A0A4Q1KQN4_9CELL|nr:type I methionyl aminopeptidase [Oerskovia turbata]RXR27431.1 type I methionyl aminopeptidase [Oerskovia turbata]RXR32341.1 type I methionyl aminopeptidase [Oerskovia turbata]TGJ95058.1 type I methionyl aminopeptidase [Actinotalea fermentans ATCC 43279 = JCM 9966 = DSM 3133]